MADNEEEREEDNEGGGRLERTCVMAILQVQPYCQRRLPPCEAEELPGDVTRLRACPKSLAKRTTCKRLQAATKNTGLSLRGQANISSSMSLSPGRHAHSTRFPAPSSSH